MVPGKGLADARDLFLVLFAGPDGALDPSTVPVTVLEGGEAEFGIEGAG